MKFFHLADVHLGASPDSGRPWSADRSKEIFESFYAVLDRASKEAVDFVFVCGDMFHRQPLKRELKELDYHFRKCAPVKIVIIAGNHDYICKESNYVNFPWSENVYFITSEKCVRLYFQTENVCVYGLSYHDYEIRDALYDELKPVYRQRIQAVKVDDTPVRVDDTSDTTPDRGDWSLPPGCCHILLAHGGDDKHIPIHWKNLEAAGFDYVALGHIHKPQLIGNGRMAYSGAPEPIDKNDEGPHGFIEGQWDKDGLHIRFVPCALRNYISITAKVTPQMSWESVKDRIRGEIAAHGSGNIFKISLEGFKDVDMVYDPEEVYRLGNVTDVWDRMEYDFDWDSLYEANAGNLLGRFIEKVRKADMDEEMRNKVLYYGFNALYRTGERQ